MAHKKSTTIIPLAAAERMLREGGAIRVSDDAKKAFVKAIEEWGVATGSQAARLSAHAGRKTIQEKDIQLAIKSRFS